MFLGMEKSPYSNSVKIFCDGAFKEEMLRYNSDDWVSGMTTNPSLMKKAGINDYVSFCKEILQSVQEKPLSFEVFADDLETMEKQAREICTWGENIYTKIPVINSEGESTLGLIKKLSAEGIKINVTAVFTEEQISKSIEALKGGAPSYLSVFAGRIADTGRDPVPMMQATVDKVKGSSIELLWASCREVWNIVQADLIGCDIITIPASILEKFKKMKDQDLFSLSKETVTSFKKDAEASGFKIF